MTLLTQDASNGMGIHVVLKFLEEIPKPFKNLWKMKILPPKVAAKRCHSRAPVGCEGMRPLDSCLPSVGTCVFQVNHVNVVAGERMASMGTMQIKCWNYRKSFQKPLDIWGTDIALPL